MVEWMADRFAPVAAMDQVQHVCHFDRQGLAGELSRAGFECEILRTFSTFAPFLAAVSWSLATSLERRERGWDLSFGNLLLAVATAR